MSDNKDLKEIDENVEGKSEMAEEEKEPDEEYLDIPQSSGNVAQAVYIEENGEHYIYIEEIA